MAQHAAVWRDHQPALRRTEAPKWSTDLLQAMNTHLCLLQQGAVHGGHCHGGGVFSVDTRHGGEQCNGDREIESGGGHYPGIKSGGGQPRGGDSFRMGMDNGGGGGGGGMLEDHCVEIDSQAPLPDGWEQFLNIKTGQIYFVDWKSCRRSYADPRRMRPALRDGGRWELPAACVAPESSDCVTDACNGGVCAMETEEDGEVCSSSSKLVTASMLEEDWELMRARGWASSLCSNDGHSEVTNAVYSQDCVVPRQDGPSMASMDSCHHCLSPDSISRHVAKHLCSQCGFGRPPHTSRHTLL